MMLISLFVLFLALTTIDAQNKCSSDDNCVDILDCPELRHLWTYPNKEFSEQTLQTFKSLQCSPEGSYPRVCCNETIPKPTTAEIREALEDTPDFPYVMNHPNLRLLNHQACGPKMDDGNKTKSFQYPWIALLRYQETNHWEEEDREAFLCSGTIISSRYILTAAECKNRGNARLIGVRVGDYDVSKERDCDLDENGREVCAERYQDFGVDEFHSHPEFSYVGQQNNIALIRLNDTIDFSSENVKPICLPFGVYAATEFRRWISSGFQKVDVPGWGMGSFDGPRSSELLNVKLYVIPYKHCRKIYYYGNTMHNSIRYKQLCAGGQIDVEHPCNGDLGGPLHAISIYEHYHDNSRTVLYGVASYGRTPCDKKLLPGVYTNVGYYMDWILNTMKD